MTPVEQRYHATSMASLILRGDLVADGAPLRESRIVSVPLLVHADGDERSPRDRLLVDLIHVALVRIFSGAEAYAPDVFVVNLAIGVFQSRFAGRISSLARLIDWWSAKEGVLFVISAGNVSEELLLAYHHADFETATVEERRAVVDAFLRETVYERSLLAPGEALNALTVGAVSCDLAPGNPPMVAGILRIDTDDDDLPAVSSAMGLGPFGAIKPDFLTVGGVHEVRVYPSRQSTRLRVLSPSQRTGLHVASPNLALRVPFQRTCGTSCAAALTTRALLQCAEALTEEGGPYEGIELSRRDVALLTRALAVNASKWPESAERLYAAEYARLGLHQHRRAKAEVARRYGYGVLAPEMMIEAPKTGVTLVGLGDVRLDQAKIFDVPLPPSLSARKVPRSLRVTIAWFSPVTLTRARYRMAALEAVAAGHDGEVDEERDDGWYLKLKSVGPGNNMIGHGTVWSRRLVADSRTTPTYDEHATMPIRVQCKDGTGNLDPDLDIRFAIVVTLEIEAEVEFDVREEVRQRLGVRVRPRGT
ncbi:MAG TPA: S8 family serine peptidase [Gammaproteobacteria bacterium]